MKNDPVDCESIGSDDFFDRTEKIDGPEIRAFKPTLQELIKLVKIHINEFVEIRYEAFITGQESSREEREEEDALWTRLDKIRRVIRPSDFKRAAEIACIQLGREYDSRIWEAFLHGDEALRHAAAIEIQDGRFNYDDGFSEDLSGRIAKNRRRPQYLPPEVEERLARPILDLLH
jgi:hypothetical protein